MFPNLQDIPTLNTAVVTLDLKGHLFIGDPHLGLEDRGKAKDGEWNITLESADAGPLFHERLKTLEAKHESVENPTYERLGNFGVDSGMFAASILPLDGELDEDLEPINLGKTDVRKSTESIVGTSGLGDGCYDILVAKENDEIVAYKIVFE